MTINKYLQQISPEDLAYVKRYHHEIQPFRVLPSSTLEFDGQFNGGGETIFTEINLNEDHTIDDMLFHISNHPFIKFPGGVLMKNPTLILTEQRQSNDKSPISTIIQQAITVWLTKELSK